MKKIILFSAVIVVIGATALVPSALAASAGNCLEPLRKTTEVLGVAVSFENNYVANRYNELNNDYSRFKDLKVENLDQYYGKVSVGVYDNFNVYGTIGGAVYDAKYVDRVEGAEIELKMDPGLYTGAGFNCLFPITERFGIGSDNHVGFFLNDIKKLSRRGAEISNAGGQLYGIDGVSSVYLSYRQDIEVIKTALIPYIGGYYSWLVMGTSKKISYSRGAESLDVEKHIQPAYDLMAFGMLVGIDIEVTKYAVFNVEGRFIGENAFTAGASIKF